MSLEEQVATALGWTSKIQGHGKVKGWYGKDGRYRGIELPNWTGCLDEALSLLYLKHWKIFTCDDGYCCEIYTAPEKGEELLALESGPHLIRVICKAFVESQRAKIHHHSSSKPHDPHHKSPGR